MDDAEYVGAEPGRPPMRRAVRKLWQASEELTCVKMPPAFEDAPVK